VKKTRAGGRKNGAGQRTPATRDLLLNAAEALMCDEGYAAVTSRRLGEKAGVTSPLIHYYFASMDDLFVALYRRHAEQSLSSLAQALQEGDVFETLWRQSRNSDNAVFFMEFMALGNHRKAVRAVMVEYAQEYRRLQYDAVRGYLKEQGLQPGISPDAAVVLIAGTGFLLGLESRFGMSFGHQSVEEAITRLCAKDG